MKKIIILLTSIISLQLSSQAQCSDAPNNFEMKLTTNNNNTISVQIRYKNEAVKDAVSALPNKNLSLDGLIFAIAWPTTSAIHLESQINSTGPFFINQDKMNVVVQNKTITDNMATFYQNTDMPVAIAQDWIANKWYEVASISYKGQLAENDFFSFATCEYGLAHPNSYSGNSHTDPWLAFFDTNGGYQQFSPKMITELPTQISTTASFNIYPNPVTNNFNLEINSTIQSQVAIQMLDVNGRILKSDIAEVQKGSNKKSINVSDFVPGNYTIKITDGKTLNYIQKVQKL